MAEKIIKGIKLPGSTDTFSCSGATFLDNGSKDGSLRSKNSALEDETYTIGLNALSLGKGTKASGDYSFAEGEGTLAEGPAGAHAEGSLTKAIGRSSHAEGDNTIASGNSQHVQGKYNVEDTTKAFIIGNGTSPDTRSNALTVDWDGNLKCNGFIGQQKGFSSIYREQKTADPEEWKTHFEGIYNQMLDGTFQFITYVDNFGTSPFQGGITFIILARGDPRWGSGISFKYISAAGAIGTFKRANGVWSTVQWR